MILVKIAFRNILRNRRRSTMAALAISVGALALLVFGAFMSALILGLKTSTIAGSGHLTIYRAGYLDFGSGNPGQYAIGRYETLMRLIGHDPVLEPMINVMTPRVTVYGIAGNFEVDRSKPFLGIGFVPSDRARMLRWDEYDIRNGQARAPEALNMSDDDPSRGVIGTGLARILGLCERLKLDHCPAAPQSGEATNPQLVARRDFSALTEGGQPELADRTSGGSRAPHIDLLAATAGGAPNVVTLNIGGTSEQSLKEVDDSYVGMPLTLAQQALFGRGEHKVTSIVLQLRHSSDMDAARVRLLQLFRDKNLDLEVHDFIALTPMYKQVTALFGSIFIFIAVIMGVIVLFTVSNTMSMTVLERTNEIGTVRAMGVQRSGVRHQFLAEGSALGVIGASSGAILAIVIAILVNRAGLHWTPPGQTYSVPLRLLVWASPGLIVGTWIGLVAMAAFAALLPATRAARLTVVNALRHV